jgi:hypothetical protein
MSDPPPIPVRPTSVPIRNPERTSCQVTLSPPGPDQISLPASSEEPFRAGPLAYEPFPFECSACQASTACS